MKWLPKPSACPHCRTVYRYADVKAIQGKRETECYHCHKKIKVKKTGVWMLALELAAVYALLNVIMLNAVRGVSILALFIVNMIPAAAAILLLPLYIELEK